MRKLILVFVIMIGFITNAQLKVTKNEAVEKTEIGSVKPMGIFTASLEKYPDYYLLMYKDAKYKQITEIKGFAFGIDDLDSLYQILTNKDAKEGESLTVELPDGGKLSIQYLKSFGVVYPLIIHYNKANIGGELPYLTNKQLAKLFGKNK